MRIIAAFALVLTLTAGCKKDDPMEKAQEALRDDPAKAIPLLQEEYNKDPNNIETIMSLAQAYKAVGEWERTAAWYRKALDHEKTVDAAERAAIQDEVLAALYKVIESAKVAKMVEKEMLLLLKQANALEQGLNKKNIQAGAELVARLKTQFEAALTAKDYKTALAAAEKLNAIYASDKDKKTILDQLPALHEKKFVADTEAAFEASVKSDLLGMKLYDEAQKALVIPAHHSIELGAEGQPDHTQDDFPAKVEAAACGPAVQGPRLAAMLNPFAEASPLGRELTTAELKRFESFFAKKRKTRWEGEAWDKTKEYPEGARLLFLCEDSMALADVIGAFRVLIANPTGKPAKN